MPARGEGVGESLVGERLGVRDDAVEIEGDGGEPHRAISSGR
jgi:hypothetical protein